MNHKFEFRSRRNPLRRAIGKDIGRAAGQKRGQRTFLKAAEVRKFRRIRRTGVVHHGRIHANTRQFAIADQERVQRRHGLDRRRPGRGSVCQHAHVDMMHNLAVARPDLRGANPLAFGEICWHDEMLVGVLAWLDAKILADIDHDVRLAEAPAFDELGRARQVARITLRSAAIHPGFDGFYFAVGQPSVIGEACQNADRRTTAASCAPALLPEWLSPTAARIDSRAVTSARHRSGDGNRRNARKRWEPHLC